MKKFILPILATLTIGLFSTSCEKEKYIESMNTVWSEFTVENWRWERHAVTGDLVCSMEWNVIDDYVLKCGNVQVYIYEVENGVTRQVPLPYLYPVRFIDGNGNDVYQPLEIRFSIERGTISFVVTDCGDYLTNKNDLPTMHFRAVCTYPVQYEMSRDH